MMALVLTVFSACRKERLITENEVPLLNKSLIDVAHFSSLEQFNNSIESLKNTGVLPVEMNGVVNLNQTMKLKSSEIDSEGELNDTLIYSEILKELLSDRYEIAIGNVFFRITGHGTFFTSIDNYEWLRGLNIDDGTAQNSDLITNALGYSFQNGLYRVNDYECLYFYDTFRKKDPIDEGPDVDIQFSKATSFPSESEWDDIDDGRTLAGKAWDSIWGFSKSVRNYFDSEHRVDVKFYAQRFPFYSEMGIKTKTQKKGWTGLWRKQDCDEIINGWEILNLKEKWPSNFFGPNFNANNNNLPNFNFQTQTAKDLAYNQSVFLNKNWKTFNLMGLEMDFSQKDKVGALWNACKSAGKVTVRYLNGKFSNPNNSKEAIRLIPKSNRVSTTEVSLAPFYDSRISTDKYTMIIASSSGGTIGVTFDSWSTFGWGGYTNLTAKYTFLQNSIMYGAARRGDVWRGVRITFK
ncbi:hypothetical protein [Gaoshiqia sp. Z1-71]|uniref:hypothetical protein n=1 Tax=Gaoshiqia hydrogeniformans TaxID=3290090 RepID=UPI003BF84E8A